MEFLRVDPASAGAVVQVSVSPTTGSPQVQIPLPLSAGRDGFGPALSLVHAGFDPMSPFAHGWSLAGLASIDIDTRDGLPGYSVDEKYRLAGQELVPLDDVARPTEWERAGFQVRAFRARIESTPIRVERWTASDGRVHWRARTGDGRVYVFGARDDGESRIADPAAPERTFRWLLESAFDRLGNAMVVRYAAEDLVGIVDLDQDAVRFADANSNRYPKRILYGNQAPLDELGDSSGASWHFEAVLDYGDHDATTPTPTPSGSWALRADVAFTARPGFEVRTRRLCRRVLMFHRFPEELGEAATLVNALELQHDEAPEATTLLAVRRIGYRTQGEARISRATPWASIAYTERSGEDAFTLLDVPMLADARLVDLFGEGLPGLLSVGAGGARYARNLGEGRFGAYETLPAWPVGIDGTLGDFDGDGNVELVEVTGPQAGYFRLDRRSREWEPLRRLAGTIGTTADILHADMSGDGRADIVLVRAGGITWFPNLGADGFGAAVDVDLPGDRMPVANPATRRFVADMTGDGLADVVEVQNGSVRYWPNLGRGRFGEPVWMDDAPHVDAVDAFDPARVLLLDLEQSGGADLLYLRGDGSLLRAPNRRGGSFGSVETIAWGPTIPNGTRVELIDVYGDGSSCLTAMAHRPGTAPALHVLRLSRAPGARQLASVTHPLGAVTELEWGHSVQHYLRDVEDGRGWDTPLPAQRPVVDAIHRSEPIDDARSSERFRYHDGHYDPRTRSFALFAVVDHYDVDIDEESDDVTPLLTRRFGHTGTHDHVSRYSFRHYAGLSPRPPPQSWLTHGALSERDFEEAWGALTGSPVCEETYAVDADGVAASHPFRVVSSSRQVEVTRSADEVHRIAVRVLPRATLTSDYEQANHDPREKLERILAVDEYLVPILSIQAGLPRLDGQTIPRRFDAQEAVLASCSTVVVVHIDEEARFELGIPAESCTFELHLPTVDTAFDEDLPSSVATALAFPNAYTEPLDPEAVEVEARALSHVRNFFWNDEQDAALALGSVGTVVLPHHSEEAAYDRAQLTSVFSTDIDPDTDLPALGFVEDEDVFFAQRPETRFAGASSFYRLEETEAFDGGTLTIASDPYFLAATSATDPVGNTSSADIDYHLVAPFRLTDPNGTVQEVDYDPLGVMRRTSRYGTTLDASEDPIDHGFAALSFGAALPSFASALADPETALGEAESLLLYEFPEGDAPMRTLALGAEQFVHRGPDAGDADARAQVGLSYLDGFGRPLQTRTLVEPGVAWVDDEGTLVEEEAATRWRVSGYVRLDAKQRPLATYEPFFRDDDEYEPELPRRQFGVASTATFDAVGRVLREDFPNGTFATTTYFPWSTERHDPNDAIDGATDYVDARDELASDEPEAIALAQAEANADTPVSQHVDALGRPFATVEVIESDVELVEQAALEIRGLSVATVDRRELVASTRVFDRLGRALSETSMDAGARRALFDAEGRQVRSWHEGTYEERTYDLAGRLTAREVTASSTTWLAERITYGEGATGAADRNQLGRVILVEDAGGTLATTRYGAFGEVLESVRTLTTTPGEDPDWSGAVGLETTGHTSKASSDALGRPTKALLPDGTERRFTYLRSGPASTLEVVTPDTTVHTILASAEFNARGQETHRELGNGVEVASTYDAETFRLYRRHATLGANTYQDLRHHYDPVGNLVYSDDLAQRPSATYVINGLDVTAERVFTYDARYQLVAATGRVHNALTRPDFRGDTPTSGSFRGTRRVGLNDGGAVSRYEREYSYDAGGNLLGWSHAPEGALPGNSWNHEKWVSSTSNRSYLAYDLDGNAVSNPASKFDDKGQLIELPNLRSMHWSATGQLRKVVLIERTGGDPDDDETYDYAADGKRIRKTTRRLVSGNVETTETVYLDGCELRRIRVSDDPNPDILILERWSSHVEVSDGRLATLYRWTTDTNERETDDTAVIRKHYHLASNVGSVSLEIDGSGGLFGYEEYFPYGGTAFVAGPAVLERWLRTQRFAGKDQDDATGFSVFQFRYYAHFLGNWVSPDPAGEVDGPNRYWYARNNPATLEDQFGLDAGVHRQSYSSASDDVRERARGWFEGGHTSPFVYTTISREDADAARTRAAAEGQPPPDLSFHEGETREQQLSRATPVRGAQVHEITYRSYQGSTDFAAARVDEIRTQIAAAQESYESDDAAEAPTEPDRPAGARGAAGHDQGAQGTSTVSGIEGGSSASTSTSGVPNAPPSGTAVADGTQAGSEGAVGNSAVGVANAPADAVAGSLPTSTPLFEQTTSDLDRFLGFTEGFAVGAAIGLVVGGLVSALAAPAAAVVGGALLLYGAWQLFENRHEVSGVMHRIWNGEGTREDFRLAGEFLGGLVGGTVGSRMGPGLRGAAGDVASALGETARSPLQFSPAGPRIPPRPSVAVPGALAPVAEVPMAAGSGGGGVVAGTAGPTAEASEPPPTDEPTQGPPEDAATEAHAPIDLPAWTPGRPISARTPSGGYPSWYDATAPRSETIQGRYWMNRALYARPGEFSDANMARMALGLAPRGRALVFTRSGAYRVIEPALELHHANRGRGVSGFDEPLNIREVWPWEHAGIDPFRRTGYRFVAWIRTAAGADL